MVASLGLDIELLSGYDSLSSFVGTVTEPVQSSSLGESSMVFNSKNGKQNMVAVFVRNDKSQDANNVLESVGFESIPLPNGKGSPVDRLSQVKGRKHDLTSEREELAKAIEEWIDANGEDLACGLEVLERDHDVLTAPTRVAVSDHAFVIDGWIEMRRSDEVTKALEPFCLYTESDLSLIHI